MPKLTPRERLLLTMLVQEKCNKEIARELGTSECAVKVAFNVLFRKLGVRSRVGAAILAIRECQSLSFDIASEYPN